MRPKLALLIVDDELANLEKLRRTFVDEFEVLEAQSGEEALSIVRDRRVAAVIADQRMPGISGVDLLRQVLEVNSDTIRIILTGYTEVEDLMDAINEGHVHRYITKPWEPFSLKQTVKQDLERWELRKENERLSQQLAWANKHLEKENQKLKNEVEFLQHSGPELVYKSASMRELLWLLDRVVLTDSTVLIQGETGTGKELLARYIHEHSRRRDQAFIPVNCGAIPLDLIESAFFGHKKGAFTGAIESKKGYFGLAHHGTLFLDEIGEAPLDLQVKLLRVLQEREIFSVGAQSSEKVDVRVIASTNRNLSQGVNEGRFRQDLFFRLNVFSVLVPPLRARREDVRLLSRFFLDRFCERLNKDIPGCESTVLDALERYDWPGNVRELENEIERLVILCESHRAISPFLLSERVRFAETLVGESGQLKQKVAELERNLILEALENHNHNKSQAAQDLGISRQTIIAKLKQYSKRK